MKGSKEATVRNKLAEMQTKPSRAIQAGHIHHWVIRQSEHRQARSLSKLMIIVRQATSMLGPFVVCTATSASVACHANALMTGMRWGFRPEWQTKVLARFGTIDQTVIPSRRSQPRLDHYGLTSPGAGTQDNNALQQTCCNVPPKASFIIVPPSQAPIVGACPARLQEMSDNIG